MPLLLAAAEVRVVPKALKLLQPKLFVGAVVAPRVGEAPRARVVVVHVRLKQSGLSTVLPSRRSSTTCPKYGRTRVGRLGVVQVSSYVPQGMPGLLRVVRQTS